MRNPYFLEEPAVVSFSGGRTSGYMLHRILEAHGSKLPDYVKVVFANTGKEMPQTLDFVRDCGEKWGVDIVWLEMRARKGNKEKGENKYVYETIETDYKNSSRKGEPFDSLLEAREMLPNVVARFCTKELKVKRIKDYMNRIGFENFTNIIGIRYDETRRAVKLHGKKSEGNECYLPLWVDKVTKQQIGEFWMNNNFDLKLPNNNGTTDWGNCDLCYLKGIKKRISIIKERPDLADWWIKSEENIPLRKTCFNKRIAQFRKDEPSYRELKIIATSNNELDLYIDDSIPCFCGD